MKTEPSSGHTFVFTTGRTYSRWQLINEMHVATETISKWKSRGLKPLYTESSIEYYWADDILAVWKQPPPKSRKDADAQKH